MARQQVVDSINTILFYQKLFDNSNSILPGSFYEANKRLVRKLLLIGR
jgi:hypothetical protein